MKQAASGTASKPADPNIPGGMPAAGGPAAGKAATVFPAGMQPAPSPGEDLSILVQSALRYSPDVQLAESKLRTAEVELQRARSETVRAALALHFSTMTQQRAIEQAELRMKLARDKLQRMKGLAVTGISAVSEVAQAELDLRMAEADRINAEAKLQELRSTTEYMAGPSLMMSQGGGAGDRAGRFNAGTGRGFSFSGVPGIAGTGSMEAERGADAVRATAADVRRSDSQRGTASAPSAALPGLMGGAADGNMAGMGALPPARRAIGRLDTLRMQLSEPTEFNLDQSPLVDLAGLIKELHRVHVVLGDNVDEGMSIRVKISNVPLYAALQAIEDSSQGQIKFAIRDYGILVTNPSDKDDKTKADPSLVYLSEFMRAGQQEVVVSSGMPRAYQTIPATKPVAAGPVGEIKVFRLQHVAAGEMSQILERLMKSSTLRIAEDSRTNSLVASGDKSELEKIEALIKQLDAPEAKSVEIRLDHASGDTLRQKLNEALGNLDQYLANQKLSLDVSGDRVTIKAAPDANSSAIQDLTVRIRTIDAGARVAELRPVRVQLEHVAGDSLRRELAKRLGGGLDDWIVKNKLALQHADRSITIQARSDAPASAVQDLVKLIHEIDQAARPVQPGKK